MFGGLKAAGRALDTIRFTFAIRPDANAKSMVRRLAKIGSVYVGTVVVVTAIAVAGHILAERNVLLIASVFTGTVVALIAWLRKRSSPSDTTTTYTTAYFTVTHPRVAAIVSAFNEQETLADIVSVLKATGLIREVLVVSDGSTDDTVRISQSLGVKTIHLHQNYGKGMAMAIGVAHTDAPVLVFVDGDIVNLSEYHLSQLIGPVVSGRAEMCIGIRHRGWLIDFFHARTGPLLSGIRCLERRVFEAVPDEYLKVFTIETALNWACGRLGLRSTTVVMRNLRHMAKERKRGLAATIRARYAMFRTVFGAWLMLSWKRPGLRAGQPTWVLQQKYDERKLDYIEYYG